MSREAMKLALEALELEDLACRYEKEPTPKHISKAITALKQALEQPEPEPVAWLITDEKINSIQVDSIQRLIDRAKHAHMTDIKLRINGQDEWYQADWLKHMIRTSPTKPEPVAWAISFDGETPYKLWDGGDCALLDIEVKRHGGKTRKMPLYTSPPKREPPCKTGSQCTTKCMECAEPEPVAWVERDGELVWNNREAAIGRNLYASPPKREPEPVIDKSAAIRIATSLGWTPQRKPLTDEELKPICDEYRILFGYWVNDFARSIEAAHGIKGEA
ncbi:MAG: hypothetical protein FGM22_10755 [Burkholderiaceae bacterium]|nr:hypothetical protein [Burkholderiaceae bacterium]